MFSDCESFEVGYIGGSTIKYLHYLENNATGVVILFSDLNADLFSLLKVQGKISPNVGVIGLTSKKLCSENNYLSKLGISYFLKKDGLSMAVMENIFGKLQKDGLFTNSGKNSKAFQTTVTGLIFKPQLSTIQEEVLFFLCEGKTGVEIAKEIYRSEAGVRKICEKLRRLFEVSSNQQLVVKALRNNWVGNPDLYHM